MKYNYRIKTDKGSEINGISNFKLALFEAKSTSLKFKESVNIYRNGLVYYRVEFPFYLRNLNCICYNDLLCYEV